MTKTGKNKILSDERRRWLEDRNESNLMGLLSCEADELFDEIDRLSERLQRTEDKLAEETWKRR